ncbi:MAG: galK [Microbacteriaceae bacterium]|nr:galK [Microbacteriaceae bacterium]
MRHIRARARDGFESVFGYRTDALWSAPGRVNLIGEHTDYNLGFVLPFAINRRTVAAVSLREDRIARVASAFADEIVEIDLTKISPDSVGGWAAYPFGVAWALGQHGADLLAVPGFDIFVESDVTVGAGLSSSAAIESAVALALNDLWGLELDRRTLAEVGRQAENEVVGAPTGIMDQSASLLGESDSAVFLDCRSLESRIVPLGLERDGLALLVIDTGITHAHATGGYADRRASCELGAKLLGVRSLREVAVDDLARAQVLMDDVTFRRVRHIVTENQRVLETVATLESIGARGIGGLLDASHLSMRDDFEISIPELNLAVETAVENGALGARMTGGGFGGAAIAMVSTGDLSRVQLAIDRAFFSQGFSRPDTFIVTAADGARRES